MKHISQALALIINLKNTADWHKEHCNDSCNVSLFQIREVVKILKPNIKNEEIEEVNYILNNWPN